MKNYINSICNEISSKNNDYLKILRWLITYQQDKLAWNSHNLKDSEDKFSEYYYNHGDFKEDMIEACKSKEWIPDGTGHDISDSQYEKYIYEYALKTIPKHLTYERVHEQDHEVILYVYTLLTTPISAGQSVENIFLSATKDTIFRPTVKPLDLSDNLSFPDRIVLVLYLWLADICTLSEYNKRIKASLDDNSIIAIDEYDAYDLWEECHKKASANKNSFLNTKGSTVEKISDLFVKFIGSFNDSNFAFAPSFVTLFINIDLGYKNAHKQSANKVSLPHNKYMVELNSCAPIAKSMADTQRISDFEKLIILPKSTFKQGKTASIEKRFDKFIDDQLARADSEMKFDAAVRYYLETLTKKGKGKEADIVKKILAMNIYKTEFMYSYFDIFRYIYDSQKMFTKNAGAAPMDVALSLLHLNVFTRWYDAVLLINNMPIELCGYNSLYLKLLAVTSPKMQKNIETVLRISENDIKKSILQKKSPIDLEKIKFLFYQKAQKKLKQNKLINILKGSDKEKYNVSQICKCIFLLDNPSYSYEYIQSLLGGEKCIKDLKRFHLDKPGLILHDNFLEEYVRDVSHCFFDIAHAHGE